MNHVERPPVYFLTAQKPGSKWRARTCMAAIVIHATLLTFLGYAGELKRVGSENIPAPPDRNLNKRVEVAPQADQAPTTPRGLTVPTHGGFDASEAAVIKALRWLQNNQNTGRAEMGSWGDRYKVAMTGLALLAYLGHGETQECHEFGQTIKEALDFLSRRSLAIQRGARFEYQHPIATCAMCEYYALTHYAPLKPACEAAVALIINAQRPDGSWDYDYNTGPGSAKRPSGDSSISAWNVQALVAAKNTGLAIPGLDDTLHRSRLWFHTVYVRCQGFGYAVPNDRRSNAMDGGGVLCLLLLGDGDDAEVKETLPCLLSAETNFHSANANSTYAWYYITQALFHAGDHWCEWNTRLCDQLVKNQDPDGSWGSPGAVAAVQHNLTMRMVQGKDSRVYHTTLIGLALEVSSTIATRDLDEKWVVAKQWQGTGNKTTEIFSVPTSPWRIRWTTAFSNPVPGSRIPNSNSLVFFDVTVYQPGKAFSISLKNENSHGSGTNTTLVHATGQFYLQFTADHCRYNVVIEQRAGL